MNKKHLSVSSCRAFAVFALTAAVLACVTAFSCQLNPEGITILGGTYDCPKLVDFSVKGKNSLQMTFSQEVSFSEIRIASVESTPEEFAGSSAAPSDTSVTENGNGTFQYDMVFQDGFDYGTEYMLYAVVEDTHGNSLSFSSSFTGFNDNLAGVVLNEVRTDCTKPKPEFVELYVTKGGNLGGLFFECFYSSKKNIYTFPAVDVHQGEYIVLHMRVMEDNSIDEIDDITLSTAADSCAEARDFWLPVTAKTIGKTGVILLSERENGPLMDALLFAESGKNVWPQEEMAEAAQTAYLSGVWAGGAQPSDAVCSDKCTATRTISRQNYTEESAASWIVTASKGSTPGAQNSSKE